MKLGGCKKLKILSVICMCCNGVHMVGLLSCVGEIGRSGWLRVMHAQVGCC